MDNQEDKINEGSFISIFITKKYQKTQCVWTFRVWSLSSRLQPSFFDVGFFKFVVLVVLRELTFVFVGCIVGCRWIDESVVRSVGQSVKQSVHQQAHFDTRSHSDKGRISGINFKSQYQLGREVSLKVLFLFSEAASSTWTCPQRVFAPLGTGVLTVCDYVFKDETLKVANDLSNFYFFNHLVFSQIKIDINYLSPYAWRTDKNNRTLLCRNLKKEWRSC